MRKTIYLSGPMTGLTYEESNFWRYRFDNAAEDFIAAHNIKLPEGADKLELEVIYPELFEDDTPSHVVVATDKASIDRSDAVVAFYWADSAGTAMEIMYAHMMDKQVYCVSAENWVLPIWVTAHCVLIEENFDRSNEEWVDLPDRETCMSLYFELAVNRVIKLLFGL